MMTENAANAKSKAHELNELSSEALDAVSGGADHIKQIENKQQMDWLRTTNAILRGY
jgi:hypothetical protein